MNAFKCDRCGEHYDGEPVAVINSRVPRFPSLSTPRLDLCQSCWAIIRSTIGTPGKPNPTKATA